MFENMFTQYDIEYMVIFAILGILFCIGLKPIRGGGDNFDHS